ncbi:MAG: hypothetical protein MSA78_00680 [Solobacterium sp.]|nr:hypothetical protein [Solobacterium sp.]
MLEDVVRESYCGVVWSHKIQEKQSDIYFERFKKMETINILLASLTSAGIIAIIFTDPLWLKLVSAILSNVRLFKDSLVKIIGDIFDSYDSLINLFGGQCQII